ncbi:unnamed protein product [Arctogadus glacialis]
MLVKHYVTLNQRLSLLVKSLSTERDDHESNSFRAQQECGWVYSPQDRATGQLCDPLGPRGQRQSERNQSGLSRPPSGCTQTASLPVSRIIANPLANMSLGGDTVWVAPS